MPTPKNVAVLVETDRGYGREVLWGVGDFVRSHEGWNLYVEPGRAGRPYHLEGWKGDGLIVQAYGGRLVEAVRATGVPTVSVSVAQTDWADAHVVMDDAAIGRQAAEHLLEHGHRHFAFSGQTYSTHSDVRGQAFADAVEDEGFDVESVMSHHGQDTLLAWQEETRTLADWLEALPRPVAILAANDLYGLYVLAACHARGLRVPEDLAVVGVANDKLVCELAQPPLSSVDPNGRRIGYLAAEVLARLMDGRTAGATPVRVEPKGVVVRRSSDLFAVEDPDVLAALSYIREHAADPIRVADVVLFVAVSRRGLERRFNRLLKRTIQDEIYRVRVARARELLARTDLAMAEVAEGAGFRRPERLSEVFKRVTGMAPSHYRRKHRLR